MSKNMQTLTSEVNLQHKVLEKERPQRARKQGHLECFPAYASVQSSVRDPLKKHRHIEALDTEN